MNTIGRDGHAYAPKSQKKYWYIAYDLWKYGELLPKTAKITEIPICGQKKGILGKQGIIYHVKRKKTNKIAMIYHILDDVDNLSNIFYWVV